MDRAARKLHSSRGAAMVLALVFLLVCVLVGVSVLMAAASNAGRSGSNRQEQQLYLALSSAMKLVTDDLADASYTGQITYTKTTDGTGKTIHTIAFEDGTMADCTFESLFRGALDQQFYAYIHDGYWTNDANNTYVFPSPVTAGPVTFTLTVKPDDKLTDYTAEIEVSVDQTLRISLSAKLTASPAVQPSATDSYVLTTVLSPSSMPTLTLPAAGPAYSNEPVKATPLTWTADRILRPAPTP